MDDDKQRRKPGLRLMNHHSLEDSNKFIEGLSGEKMTSAEFEELRQLLAGMNERSAELPH
jgi:hypothetical protein